MNRCSITFEPCQGRYSARGLRLLSRRLRALRGLDLTSAELRQEAAARCDRMSVQGVQPKLSAVLNVAEERFDLVDRGGRYILKPPVEEYPEVPQNENLTMHLAARAGVEVPLHGLVFGPGGEPTYFIRRFDRGGRRGRLHVEDFAQLSGQTRDTKYRSSMERVAAVIDEFCSFPAVDRVALFRLTVVSFLVGNEDLHLKNFSLLHDGDAVRLAPAYDLLNSTVVLRQPQDELALPLNGKKTNLRRRDLVDYFGRERLALPPTVVDRVLAQAQAALADLPADLEGSLMTHAMQARYRRLVEERSGRLFGPRP